ncbi:MAG: heavy metal-responsive transcriptional regulator [Chloroflexi bacterium]|nr:heavy metal-responsive transcriptional regulator [Chloroflexota bacterium]MBI4267937.1 heavy metal-responsive transcriptional regulator [Chloroflexota bacterium]
MKDRLSIGKVSRQLGTPAHTIRYYERLGLLPPASRAANSYRIYTKEHVERLQFIQKAKQFGLSLDEIKQLVDIRAGGTMPCEEVRRLIKTHLEELDIRVQKMIAFRDELAERYQQLEEVGAALGVVCGLIEQGGASSSIASV